MTSEEAISKLKSDCRQMNLECACKGDGCRECHIKMAIDALENQATSDKASDNYEIVHCKDCKHWYADATVCTENVRRCGIANYLVGGNGFCIYGEYDYIMPENSDHRKQRGRTAPNRGENA